MAGAASPPCCGAAAPLTAAELDHMSKFIAMSRRKSIALVAHDNKRADLLE
jgi:hypothetical protein